MRLRSLRGSRPPSRTERASTSSASYSSRSRSPGYGNEPTTAPVTTTPTRNAPTSWQLQSGSALTWGSSQIPPSLADETPANWPNGSDASPTGERYSTPRTMGLETSPTPSNYTPPSTFPTTHRPRASPDGSSTPLLAPRPPSTLSVGPPMLPSTGGSMPTSSATTSSTRRPRLSTIASATSRQRFREFWQTSGLPLDVSREPEPRLAWDMSDSEPEALGRPGELGGDAEGNNG